MEAEPTLDPEVAEAERPPLPPVTLEQCLADISATAMPAEDCDDLMRAYCTEHPDSAWCPRRKAGG